MLFSVAFGVPEKSVFTRLFCVFATDMLANFQDRLVMTASITLRRVICFLCESKAQNCANGFQDSCPSENIVKMCASIHSASFILIFVTRFKKRHAVSFFVRLPVITASITLQRIFGYSMTLILYHIIFRLAIAF